MSLSKLTENLNNVSSLADKPSLQSDELKAEFDKAGNSIKEYINSILTQEVDNIEIELKKLIQSNTNKIEDNQRNIFNLIYPIGSIYISTNTTEPSTLFGGTWQQIKDRFLLSAGSTYLNGETGGEATHKLTKNEMPSHTHTFTGTKHYHGTGNYVIGEGGSFDFRVNAAIQNDTDKLYTDVSDLVSTSKSGNTSYYNSKTGSTSTNRYDKLSVKSHNHTLYGTSDYATAGGSNSDTGSDTAHNNMPPYLVVNVWKRIS